MSRSDSSRTRGRVRTVIGVVVLLAFVAGVVATVVMIGVDTITGHAGEQAEELDRPVLDETLDRGEPAAVLDQVHAHLNAVIWGGASLDPDTAGVIDDVVEALEAGGPSAALEDAARSVRSGDLYEAHDEVADVERAL